jgi:hypothetical protein
MSETDYLIELFGNTNDELDEDELSDLMEEILTLDDESLFDITCESISFGKWQILGSILSEKEFSEKQIQEMKHTLEDYLEDSDEKSTNSVSDEECDEIYQKMGALISRVEEDSRDPDRVIEKMRHNSRIGQKYRR